MDLTGPQLLFGKYVMKNAAFVATDGLLLTNESIAYLIEHILRKYEGYMPIRDLCVAMQSVTENSDLIRMCTAELNGLQNVIENYPKIFSKTTDGYNNVFVFLTDSSINWDSQLLSISCQSFVDSIEQPDLSGLAVTNLRNLFDANIAPQCLTNYLTHYHMPGEQGPPLYPFFLCPAPDPTLPPSSRRSSDSSHRKSGGGGRDKNSTDRNSYSGSDNSYKERASSDERRYSSLEGANSNKYAQRSSAKVKNLKHSLSSGSLESSPSNRNSGEKHLSSRQGGSSKEKNAANGFNSNVSQHNLAMYLFK